MKLMGREIGVKLCHQAIRKKGAGDDSQDERQPKMATQGKEPTQAATQIVETRGTREFSGEKTPIEELWVATLVVRESSDGNPG